MTLLARWVLFLLVILGGATFLLYRVPSSLGGATLTIFQTKGTKFAPSTDGDRVRLALIFHQNGFNIVKLEALFITFPVAHTLDPEKFLPPSRVAHRARDETQLLQARVVISISLFARKDT